MKKIMLKKYAELLIKKGVALKPNQELNVYIAIDQEPLAKEIAIAAYKAGAERVNFEWQSDEISRIRYKRASIESLSTLNKWELARLQHRVDKLPARLYIASSDPDAMKGIDQEKVAAVRRLTYPVMKPYIDKVDNKEQWCIAAASSPAWARKVFPGLTKAKAVEKLWEAIFVASRITDDPIREWEEHNAILSDKCQRLNELGLKSLHYTSSNGTDFTVGLLPNALWMGGSEIARGSDIEFNPNIPSEEVFTSPRKGDANGIVYATKPLSYQGELIDEFSVRFENGKAVEVHAKKGENLLKEMISMDENAPYLGECALIPFDSPINNTGILFYETLFDENASCHLALGRGFTNVIKGYENYTQDELTELGINDSMIHVDFMIGSADMRIVGIDKDDNEVVIFDKGNWAF